MTRDEFIASYCARSGVTWEWLSKYRTAIKCACGDQICEGWQMLPHDHVKDYDEDGNFAPFRKQGETGA